MIGKPFGGEKLKSHPKTKRPFSRRHLIHLILKSSQAKGALSFLHPRRREHLNRLVRKQAARHGVKLQDFVNVGNHLHILIRAGHRRQLFGFVRSVSGLIPRKILKCERGSPLKERFWDARPFTKIVADGKKAFAIVRRYFDKNRRQAQYWVEGFDFIPETGFG